jgi:hypothetical protein
VTNGNGRSVDEKLILFDFIHSMNIVGSGERRMGHPEANASPRPKPEIFLNSPHSARS